MGLPVEVNNLMMGAVGGYQISRSLRFRNSAQGHLSRTLSVAGNRRTLTISAWVKWRGYDTGSASDSIFSVGPNNSTRSTGITFIGSGYSSSPGTFLNIAQFNGSSNDWQLVTSQVFRDPSAWYHIVLAIDTSQATASNRIKLYVNGVQVTAFSTANYPSQNSDTDFGSTSYTQYIGRDGYASASNRNYDGYMADFYYVDGQALTPSSFGETDAITGVWNPKKYSGTYGTNGFYLNFSDNSGATATTIGKDYSGNGNNWTPNNISVTAGTTYDSMIDSPTPYADGNSGRGNYAVLNPLDTGSSGSVSAGNLTHSSSGGGVTRSNASIRVPSSGKFYAEFINSSATNANIGLGFGVSADSVALNAAYNAANSYHFYASNAAQAMNSGTTISISSWTNSANQTFQLSVDVDNSKVWIGQNNVWWDSSGGTTGNPSTGANPTFSISSSGFKIFTSIDTTSSVNWNANFGQRSFSYTPPSGFKALNSYNLPAASISNGAKHFAATTYTGDSVDGRSITNGGNNPSGITMQPDLVWIKDRSSGSFWNVLFDSVRGAGNQLSSNQTDAELASASNVQGKVSAFNSNGFTLAKGSAGTYSGLGSVNYSPDAYVAWQWKGGGTAVTNNSGTISSQVSANTSAGFSIVTYTGTGANATVGHGLGVAPQFIFAKKRSAAGNSWRVYHVGLTSAAYSIELNTTAAQALTADVWNSTVPTSSVFSVGVGGDVNASGATYVAYCFSAVSGFSAFGKYNGTGSSDGPMIYTGFRPRFVMVKSISGGVGDWEVRDSSRDIANVSYSSRLFANSSAAEDTSGFAIDLLSNGFKCRGTGTNSNGSGYTYIYMALAEAPFNLSRAR